MTWQIAIGLSIMANVATTLIQRRYAKRSTAPATFPIAASYIFGVLPVGLTAGFFIFPHTIAWSWWLVLLLAIEGCSMAISGATGFKAAGKLDVAPDQTIGRITSVTAILLGWTILGEGLTRYQFIGGLVLLAAALLAIWAPARASTKSLHKIPTPVLILAIISAITLAFGLVTEKAVLGHVAIGGVFLIGWTSQAFAMVLLAAKDVSRQRLKAFANQELKIASLMGAVNGLTGVFYVYALAHSNNISLISALTAIALPLSVFGAYVLLHERQHHKLMWFSLGLGFIGLLITSIR